MKVKVFHVRRAPEAQGDWEGIHSGKFFILPAYPQHLKFAKVIEKGYVILPNKTKDWQETCWHFLNWSCWRDEKPVWVKSPLEYCNSDVILKRDDDDNYYAARHVGFVAFPTLKEAIESFYYEDLWEEEE